MRLGLTLGTSAAVLLVLAGAAGAQPAPQPQAPTPLPAEPPPPPAAAPGSETQAPAPAPAGDDSCVPRCRSGFMCQAGVCISACNPPCPAGQECTAAGECVAVAPPPPQYPPPPPPAFYPPPLPEPPPPLPPPPGAREHDGFMLRGTLGIGGAGITESTDVGGDYEAVFSGVSVGLSLDIGFSLITNLVLHARFAYLATPSPSLEVDGEDRGDSDYTILNLMLAPALSYYFMPINIYVTAAVGVAWLGFDDDRYNDDLSNESDELTDAGIGLNLDVGKEWWIGRQFGLGVAGRFWYTGTVGDFAGEEFDYTLTGFTVLLSATFQ